MKGKDYIYMRVYTCLICLYSDVSAHNDRRSAHNALERQRREHLNVKFQQLAHALPALSTVRRPSKTMIVAKSLEFGNVSNQVYLLLILT